MDILPLIYCALICYTLQVATIELNQCLQFEWQNETRVEPNKLQIHNNNKATCFWQKIWTKILLNQQNVSCLKKYTNYELVLGKGRKIRVNWNIFTINRRWVRIYSSRYKKNKNKIISLNKKNAWCNVHTYKLNNKQHRNMVYFTKIMKAFCISFESMFNHFQRGGPPNYYIYKKYSRHFFLFYFVTEKMMFLNFIKKHEIWVKH